MSEKKLQGQIVTEYLEKFPHLNTRTLARLIYEENPQVFTDLENARSRVRYYRGATGKQDRSKLADNRFLREPGTYNYFMVPQSDEEPYEPFTLPRVNNNILFMYFPVDDPIA